MMGKSKGRGKGRGRPKASLNECEEPPKEPSGIQTESNASMNTTPKGNKIRPGQFQDADDDSEVLKRQKHCPSNSKGQTSPNTALDECNRFERAQCRISDVDGQCSSSTSTARASVSSKTTKIDIARRPNFGTSGNKIAIVSNYFLLKGRGNNIYHYDVEINDKSASAKNVVKTIKEEKASGTTQLEIQQKRNVGKQKRREVINQLMRDQSLSKLCLFFDGYKNLYAFQELPVGAKKSAEVRLIDGKRTKTYIVTVQPVNKNGNGNIINLESLNNVCSGRSGLVPLEAVMAFDIILCHRDPPYSQVGIRRSFFSFTEMRSKPVDEQIEIWKGYNNSLQLTQRGPAVLVDVANKAFHCTGFVIEQACSILGFDITESNLSSENIQKLTKNLRGLKVEVTHLSYPRTYIVESVTKESANNLIVYVENKKMSVSQFFAWKYDRLKFPYLPCLSMKTTGKPTYTPMEVCVIPPAQPKLGKLSPKQTADMINMTAIAPVDRFDRIENSAKAISQISGPYLKYAGYNMELTPLRLTARVISAPALAYSNEPCVRPDPRGVWRIDGRKFSESSSGVHWILISFARKEFCSREMLEHLSSELVKASKKVGLDLRRPTEIILLDETVTTYDALHYAQNVGISFVLVVLSRRDQYHNYDELKFIADVKLGLITQCMEDVVVKKCREGQGTGQILNNLLSKLNAKLGGTNHTFSKQPSICMSNTIVMGADAAHSPRGSRCPSIAAVVGSIDDVPFQYAVSCKVQRNRDKSKLSQEIILDMKEMTKHILNSYRNRNGYFPRRIIFFRDGVSQGQFAAVLAEELNLIQEACDELFGKIPVTFIVVQKRHQTRFKPQDPKHGVGKFGNVPPGTTVDTDVTHPVYFDYFLCSHEGIRGTSKPAHYVVLHDDNRFQADELQQFCYDLCHVYTRCNRSISIPAPAMNAHLAAARAKKYIDWHLSKDTSSSSGYSNDEPTLPQEVIDFVNNISDIKAPMFFV